MCFLFHQGTRRNDLPAKKKCPFSGLTGTSAWEWRSFGGRNGMVGAMLVFVNRWMGEVDVILKEEISYLLMHLVSTWRCIDSGGRLRALLMPWNLFCLKSKPRDTGEA